MRIWLGLIDVCLRNKDGVSKCGVIGFKAQKRHQTNALVDSCRSVKTIADNIAINSIYYYLSAVLLLAPTILNSLKPLENRLTSNLKTAFATMDF